MDAINFELQAIAEQQIEAAQQQAWEAMMDEMYAQYAQYDEFDCEV